MQVVEVLLDDHVAATGEGRILRADQHRLRRRRALRILRPVDESEDVSVVERAEAVDLIDHLAVPRSRSVSR